MSLRDEYEARKRRGEPLANAADLSFALMDLQRERTVERSPTYYLINRLLNAIHKGEMTAAAVKARKR